MVSPIAIKGHPKMGGRKAGTPNKRTVYVKRMLEDAAISVGGLERLVEWIKEKPENEYAFWTSMFMRLLPVQLQGTGQDGALVVEVRREELAKKLEERGLPTIVFGVDTPTIDAKVEEIASGGEGDDDQGIRSDAGD